METTKQQSSRRQTEAAIRMFHEGKFDCAITLAAAAEGMLPDTNDPHLFQALRGAEEFQELKLNLMINWLKHSNSPETRANVATLNEFEAAFVIARAITKFNAVYHLSCMPFEEFLKWAIRHDHLPRQIRPISD